jgi:type IV secretion system protein TrbJ
MTPFLRKCVSGLSIGTTVLAGMSLPIGSAQALVVFDPSNYSQSLLVAARTLQQVNQQITQIQNQIRIIEQLERNLKKLDVSKIAEITGKLAKIDALMAQARAINFKVSELKTQFKTLFPGERALSFKGLGIIKAAQTRLDAVMAGYEQAMTIQSQIVENISDDATVLKDLVDQSQQAQGSLQVSQATNQLLALTAKQQFQLQSLLAAQGRSDALEAARRAQAEHDGRTLTKRFLGSGKANPPQ